MRLRIVTGRRGAGKTTFVGRWVEGAQSCGRRVGGVLAPAVCEQGERVGYDVRFLGTGARFPLARRVGERRGFAGNGPSVGRFVFSRAAFSAGEAQVRRDLAEGCGVMVFDEVGPLEIGGGGWSEALALTIRESDAVCGVIVVVRPGLVEVLRDWFPRVAWRDGRVIEVSAGGVPGVEELAL